MRRGREWEGVLSCRRRSGELLHLPSRVVPGSARRSSTQYLVYLSDSHHHPLPTEKLCQPSERSIDLTTDHFHPRGSIKSLRKGSHSHDIRSINSDGERTALGLSYSSCFTISLGIIIKKIRIWTELNFHYRCIHATHNTLHHIRAHDFTSHTYIHMTAYPIASSWQTDSQFERDEYE